MATVGPTDPDTCNAPTTIQWQFRPILGRDYVQSGIRNVYAELAFPAVDEGQAIGILNYSTSWHTYDGRNGSVGPVIPGFETAGTTTKLFGYASSAAVGTINVYAAQGGQAVTHIDGVFTPGTQVRLGNTLYSEGPNLLRTDKELEFSAPITDLMAYAPTFLLRNGKESEIAITGASINAANPQQLDHPATHLTIDTAMLEPQQPGTHLVSLTMSEAAVECAGKVILFPNTPLLAQIGASVYGLDPQLARYKIPSGSGCTRQLWMSFAVKDTDLVPGGVLRVRRLFSGGDYDLKFRLETLRLVQSPLPNTTTVTLVSHDSRIVTFALQGNGIEPAAVQNGSLAKAHLAVQKQDLLIYTVSTPVYKSLDSLLVLSPTGEIQTVAVPPLPKPPAPVNTSKPKT